MRYYASYTVTFDASSDAEARSIAANHYELLRDEIRVEGADHPHDITLDRLQTDGHDILQTANDKLL